MRSRNARTRPNAVPDAETALQAALRLLAYRARSEHELRDRLRRKGLPDPLIEETMATLRADHFLDDVAFTADWISAHPEWGRTRLRSTLAKKGIERSLAENSIATGLSTEDEFAAACDVARRALRRETYPVERPALLRLRGLLQRRGFSFDVIGRVCARCAHCSAEEDWLE